MTGYLVLFSVCAASGLAIPAPEDVPLIYAGIQIHAGQLGFLGASLAAGAGLLLRDGVFFGLGRLLGERALVHPRVRRFIGEGRLESARRMISERGSGAVLLARALVGFRAAAFLVAGAMGVSPTAFVLWDLVGLCVTVPLLLGLGIFVGPPALLALQWLVDHPAAVALGASGLLGVSLLWRQHRAARVSAIGR